MPVCAHPLKKCGRRLFKQVQRSISEGCFWRFYPLFSSKIAPSDPQNRVKWDAIGGKYGCAMLLSLPPMGARAGGLAALKTCS